MLLQKKKRKRTEKTKVAKLRYELERVCLKDSELPETIEESETIEKEVLSAIEAGQTAIKTRACKTVHTGRPISVNMTENYDQQPGQKYQLNESHGNQDDQGRFLKPLKVPTFSVTNKSLKIFGPFLEV